jgi:hypothetical protein
VAAAIHEVPKVLNNRPSTCLDHAQQSDKMHWLGRALSTAVLPFLD